MSSNYCEESYRGRWNDCINARVVCASHARKAIAMAMSADLPGAMKALDDALAKLSSMRSDLQDLAYEAERRRDAGL